MSEKPQAVVLENLSISDLQGLLQSLNNAIEHHTGCEDCPPPLMLTTKRDEVENELELRGA